MTSNTESPKPPRADRARQEPLPGFAIGVATAIDLAAAAALIAGPLSWGVCGVALVLHLISTGSLMLGRRLRGSRRSLLLAFSLALPVVGAAAVVLALSRTGRDPSGRSELEVGIRDEEDDHDELAPDTQVIRQVGEALPAAEALLVAGIEERRAMLWGLGRRADADAIALLRWALTAASPELGLEAALALEDLSISFEKRLEGHRKMLAATPSHAEAMAAGEWITHGVEVGILDVGRMRTFASEARKHFTTALGLAPEAGADVGLARAKLELAVLRPDKALDVLDEVLATGTTARHDELRRLRDEAALRSHDLPWEGASLLATYRRQVPPRWRQDHQDQKVRKVRQVRRGKMARRGMSRATTARVRLGQRGTG